MKKIAILTVAIFALAFTVSPALAGNYDRDHDHNCGGERDECAHCPDCDGDEQDEERECDRPRCHECPECPDGGESPDEGELPEEDEEECCISNDIILNENIADITNNVQVNANTGGNWVGGSYGGNGGDAGDIYGDEEVEESVTGNGGNGGDGNVGGTITTGDATAHIVINNKANENDTEIDRCCDEDVADEECNDNCGNDIVLSRNSARLVNNVQADLDTGYNDAEGSFGGNGGEGGSIKDGEEVEESCTGDGGEGGAGGEGGLITTGDAVTTVDIMNVVNRNITRVLR